MAVPRAFIRITVRWPLDILPVACMWPVHITCTIPFIHKQSYWLAGGCVSDVTARSMPYTRKKEEEIGGNFERASERQNRNYITIISQLGQVVRKPTNPRNDKESITRSTDSIISRSSFWKKLPIHRTTVKLYNYYNYRAIFPF